MIQWWFLIALVAVIVAGASLAKPWWPKLPWHSQHRRDVVLTGENIVDSSSRFGHDEIDRVAHESGRSVPSGGGVG
jgi:hypothetical protein